MGPSTAPLLTTNSTIVISLSVVGQINELNRLHVAVFPKAELTTQRTLATTLAVTFQTRVVKLTPRDRQSAS